MKTFRLTSTVFIFFILPICIYSQKDTIKAPHTGEVRNITSELLRSGTINTHIANLSGFELSETDQTKFQEAVLNFKNAGIGVFDLGVPVITIQFDGAFESILGQAQNQIESSKYILFCYGLNPNAEEESLRSTLHYWIDLKLGLEKSQELFLAQYVAEEMLLYTYNSLSNGAITSAMEFGLALIDDYLNNDNETIFESPENGAMDILPKDKPKYQQWFLAPNGQPIRMPSNIISLVVTSNKMKGGFPKMVPLGFRVKETNGDIHLYMAQRAKIDSTISHGYATKKVSTDGIIETIFFPFEIHDFAIGSNQGIFFCSNYDECNSYELTSYLYKIPNPGIFENYLKGRKITDKEIWQNINKASTSHPDYFSNEEMEVIPILNIIRSRQLPCANFLTPAMLGTLKEKQLYYFPKHNIHVALTEVGIIMYYHDYSTADKFYYQIYDWGSAKMQELEIVNLDPFHIFLIQFQKAFSGAIHGSLDFIGMVPIAGEIADLANGGIYLLEGDSKSAAFSFGAAAVGIGIAAVAGKYFLKASKSEKKVHALGYTDEAGKFIRTDEKMLQVIKEQKLSDAQRLELNKILGGSKNIPLKEAFIKKPELLVSWQFLFGSPYIRNNLDDVENMAEVLATKFYKEAGMTEEALRVGVNKSTSKTKMIKRLKNASKEGSSVEQMADALKLKGRDINYQMLTPPNQLDDAFTNLPANTPNANLTAKWNARQLATTKSEKIKASEALGEARADQLYKDMEWQRLDVEGIPPGKQGKFDRIFEDPATGKIHVVEAKGGSGNLGSRLIEGDEVAQQGTKQYMDNIINNLLQKLGTNDPLYFKLVNAADNQAIEYTLVIQKTDIISNFIFKKFPIAL